MFQSNPNLSTVSFQQCNLSLQRRTRRHRRSWALAATGARPGQDKSKGGQVRHGQSRGWTGLSLDSEGGTTVRRSTAHVFGPLQPASHCRPAIMNLNKLEQTLLGDRFQSVFAAWIQSQDVRGGARLHPVVVSHRWDVCRGLRARRVRRVRVARLLRVVLAK